jgi:hypothetical protein
MEFTVIRHRSLTRDFPILCKIKKEESSFGDIIGAVGHPYPGSEPHFKLASKASVTAQEMIEIAEWMKQAPTK